MPELRNSIKILLLSLILCSTPALAQKLPVAKAVLGGPVTEKVSPVTSAVPEGPVFELPSVLQAELEFLSDTLRLGRKFGTRGLSDAAFYVQREFLGMGLRTSMDHFRFNGKTGHNVIGLLRNPASSKYIIVMAAMDGVGEYEGVVYPGADANASGVAALLSLARSFTSPSGTTSKSSIAAYRSGASGNGRAQAPSCNVLFVGLDGHNDSSAGAQELWSWLGENGISKSDIAMVVNLDTMGSNLAPPQRYWKDYLIILGGAKYEKSILSCNDGLGLHMYFDYYDSRAFTDMFYRRVGDQSVFVSHGVPAVMVTSGITMRTNKPTDTVASLSVDLLARRIELLRRWLIRFAG